MLCMDWIPPLDRDARVRIRDAKFRRRLHRLRARLDPNRFSVSEAAAFLHLGVPSLVKLAGVCGVELKKNASGEYPKLSPEEVRRMMTEYYRKKGTQVLRKQAREERQQAALDRIRQRQAIAGASFPERQR